jgi:hypothetical protein
MYRWHPEGAEKRRQAFVRKMFKQITSAYPNEGFDYVHIQSLSGMGILESELVLSANHLDVRNGRVKCLLPPSPTGNVGIYKSGSAR